MDLFGRKVGTEVELAELFREYLVVECWRALVELSEELLCKGSNELFTYLVPKLMLVTADELSSAETSRLLDDKVEIVVLML